MFILYYSLPLGTAQTVVDQPFIYVICLLTNVPGWRRVERPDYHWRSTAGDTKLTRKARGRRLNSCRGLIIHVAQVCTERSHSRRLTIFHSILQPPFGDVPKCCRPTICLRDLHAYARPGIATTRIPRLPLSFDCRRQNINADTKRRQVKLLLGVNHPCSSGMHRALAFWVVNQFFYSILQPPPGDGPNCC